MLTCNIKLLKQNGISIRINEPEKESQPLNLCYICEDLVHDKWQWGKMKQSIYGIQITGYYLEIKKDSENIKTNEENHKEND